MRYKAGYKVVRVIEDNLVSALVDRGAFTYYIGLATSRKKDFGPMGVFDEFYYAESFMLEYRDSKRNLQIWECIYKESRGFSFYRPNPLDKNSAYHSFGSCAGACFADEVVLIKPYNYRPPREIRRNI